MRKPSISIALTLSVAALSVLSCSWPGFGGSRGAGSLRLEISDRYAAASMGGARTVAPASDRTAVTSYVLTAHGPSATLEPVTASSSGYVFTDLEVGTWMFEAVGKNVHLQEVTYGFVFTTISDNVESSETIVMNPASGDGTYSVSVTWVGVSGVSHIETSLTTLAGEAAADPTIGSIENGISCGGTLASGMYKLRLRFTDGRGSIWVSEGLQIFGGLQSLKTIALSGDYFIAPPPAPTGLTATASNRTVVLNWSEDYPAEDAFILERSVDGGDYALLSDTIEADVHAYTDADVSFAHSYTYRIFSKNEIGVSAPSNESAFTPIRVTDVSLDPDFYLHVAGTSVMNVSIAPADAFETRVTWSSSNPAVASVDAGGEVTALSVGASTIRATAVDGGIYGERVVTVCPAPEITAFGFTLDGNPSKGLLTDCVGDIDPDTGSISIFVPFGATRTGLIATFTYAGASIKVGTTDQISGETPNDYTIPATYKVTAIDGYSVNYTVTLCDEDAGMAGIAFTPNPLVDVVIDGIPVDGWLKTGAAFDLTALTTQGGSSVAVDSYQWYIDRVPVAGAAGTGPTLTISAALNLTNGSHRIAVYVKKNGYSFAAEATLNVVKRITRALIPGIGIARESGASPPRLSRQGGGRHA